MLVWQLWVLTIARLAVYIHYDDVEGIFTCERDIKDTISDENIAQHFHNWWRADGVAESSRTSVRVFCLALSSYR